MGSQVRLEIPRLHRGCEEDVPVASDGYFHKPTESIPGNYPRSDGGLAGQGPDGVRDVVDLMSPLGTHQLVRLSGAGIEGGVMIPSNAFLATTVSFAVGSPRSVGSRLWG